MYIGKRGDKKSVMNHFYYTMKIYIGSYPSEIIGREMLEIADEISSILGCTYEKLGYSLLHPDYDYKQIGKSFRNGKKGENKIYKFTNSYVVLWRRNRFFANDRI